MIEKCQVADLHTVAHKISRLIVTNAAPGNGACFRTLLREVVDRVTVALGFDQPIVHTPNPTICYTVFMNAIMESQVFFFISSVGFVVLGILAAIILIIGVRIAMTFSRIMSKLERDIEEIGDTTRELVDELRDSMIFRLFFKGRKRSVRK